MRWMLRNSRGKRDALLTVGVIGALVVFVKVLLNGASMVLDAHTFNFGTIDATLAGVTLGALAPYTFKRLRGGKNDAEQPEEPKP